MRDAKKRVKELAEALKREPGSVPKRLELAAALREAQRPVEAIDLYRGIAEAYAEEGRLVQAMAVCKGILEIDPEHRDTLEMLADLANKRSRPRLETETELRREGERWVAHPPGAEPAHDDDETSASGGTPLGDATPSDHNPLWGSALYEDEDVDEVPGEPTDPSMPAPPQQTVVGRRPSSAPRPAPPVDEERSDEEAPREDDLGVGDALSAMTKRPLDFPDETKRLARGDRLLAFAPREKTEVLRPDPTPPPSTAAPDPTRAGTPSALSTGRPPSAPPASDELSWDEESGEKLLADALAAPFPRSQLSVEPPPFPLLSELPRAAFLELVARMSVVRLAPGETVLREGEAGDACYLIASGRVRVLKAGIEVARLEPGAFFGEFAVLADQRRHASVETLDEVELLEIRRALLDELVAAHPGVARTLRTFYRERLMSTLLATAPFFSQLSNEERRTIAERFRPRRFGRGAHIIDEGSAGGGLYLILVGEVAVVHGSGKEEKILGKLGEGSYFGEMSLLKGGVASATVRAARMTEVVQLPPRDFYEIVSQHPVLWEQLRSEAERREMANHALLTGEARENGDGSVYLL